MTAARRIDLTIIDGMLTGAHALGSDAAPVPVHTTRPSEWRRQWVARVDGYHVTITVAPRPCRDDP